MKHITIPLLLFIYSGMLVAAILLPSRRPVLASTCEKLIKTSMRIYKKDIKELQLRELLTVIIDNTRKCNAK